MRSFRQGGIVLRIDSHSKLLPDSYHQNSKTINLNIITLFRSSHNTSEPPKKLRKVSFKRQRFSAEINRSIARNINEWNPQIFPSCEQTQIQDALADHSYRRIQIFYYQALVYFGAGCNITLGRTEVQHGTSNFPWSSAAHSSLLTNLNDDYLEILKYRLYEEGMTVSMVRTLKALGVPDERIEACKELALNTWHVEYLLQSVVFQNGLIHPHSTLYASMNATVELPNEVNQFDCVIEGYMRGKALQILNQVSKERLHPYRATEILVAEMGAFFQKSLNETREKIALLKKMESLEQTLWFIECNLTTKAVDIYLKLIKDLKNAQCSLNNLKTFSMQRKSGFTIGWRSALLDLKKPTNKKIVNKVKKKSGVTFPPPSRENYIKILENSLEIINLQWNSTRVPPIKSLVKDFSEEKIFEEQLQIIRRD
jgi:hypothetical protein